jgi:conjugative relaxase-like TrwC/TraI family protein
MIRILPNSDTSGAYLLGQPAREVAELPGIMQHQWLGNGARLLGLEGPVHPDDLVEVLRGRPPGTTLRPDPRRSRSGFDLVIAAPKSASVLFASADAHVAAEVVRVHEESVTEAITYLEQRAASVRRGDESSRVGIPVDGLIAAGFTHGLSRAGDPHLHSHVLVANLAHGSDGRFSALDTGGLRFHASAADALYRAHLRAELSNSLGVRFERCDDGRLEIEGISDAVLVACSRRSAEVSAGARFSAEERWVPSRAEAVAHWAERRRDVVEFPGRPRMPSMPHLDEHRLAGMLHGRSPRAREGLAAICDAAGPGITASSAVSFLTHLNRDLGHGVHEARLPERSFLATPTQIRFLGPRPLHHRALARWRIEAERLDLRRDLHRDRSGISLERSERHGSSR